MILLQQTQMYGEDKTTIEELKNTITELEKLKIEIIEKSNKTSELNNAIGKMESKINQADDKILNTEKFAKTGNETTENEQNAVNEENTSNTQNEIIISEDSNVDVLMDNIDTLVNKVNEQVKAETERKAEEERKAKELEAKKVYAGTYKNSQGKTETITINENGDLYYNSYKIDINKKDRSGAIIIYRGDTDGCLLYPVGTTLAVWDSNTNGEKATDKNKIRILFHGGGVPDINTDVYYKLD